MKNQQRLIVGLVLTLVLIVFALLNGQGVAVNFFGAQFTWPLIVVIVVSVLIGALITALVSTASMSQNKKSLEGGPKSGRGRAGGRRQEPAGRHCQAGRAGRGPAKAAGGSPRAI